MEREPVVSPRPALVAFELGLGMPHAVEERIVPGAMVLLVLSTLLPGADQVRHDEKR